MSLALLLGTMLALAGLGVPLVFALLGASLLTLLVVRPGLPLEVIPQLFVQGIDSFALLAIALFFLAGELMSASGVIARILGFSRALVGHIHPGSPRSASSAQWSWPGSRARRWPMPRPSARS
jgi:TRAP-type mannitol/chloroaromatic compound transport system permease large subunit